MGGTESRTTGKLLKKRSGDERRALSDFPVTLFKSPQYCIATILWRHKRSELKLANQVLPKRGGSTWRFWPDRALWSSTIFRTSRASASVTPPTTNTNIMEASFGRGLLVCDANNSIESLIAIGFVQGGWQTTSPLFWGCFGSRKWLCWVYCLGQRGQESTHGLRSTENRLLFCFGGVALWHISSRLFKTRWRLTISAFVSSATKRWLKFSLFLSSRGQNASSGTGYLGPSALCKPPSRLDVRQKFCHTSTNTPTGNSRCRGVGPATLT